MPDNLKRMLQLVDEFFDIRHDPEQLQVSPAVIQRLHEIHPATLAEQRNDDGPICWILVIPTTTIVMNDFLAGKISENQLLERTKPGDTFEAIYLCSASVLPEFRHKGIATKLSCESINSIRSTHPIKALYVWPFSEEGRLLSEKIAQETNLPLYLRPGHEK